MEVVLRQTWAFLFRGYHLTRRYISWVVVFNFYAVVTSATVALIGVAANDYQLTLTLVVGAFFIPKSFGTSIALTGGVEFALWGFLIFYVTCLAITWWFYTRRGGLLYDVERRSTSRRMASAAAPAE